jgi:hypothetical protein
MQVVDSSSRDPLPGAMDIHMQLLRTPVQRQCITVYIHAHLTLVPQYSLPVVPPLPIPSQPSPYYSITPTT